MPVLSWLLLRGKCRNCGVHISPRYPAIELLTALAFGAIVLLNGVDKDLIWELPFAAMLIAVAGIDLEHRIIPNKVLLPSAVFGIATAARCARTRCAELGIAGAGAFVVFLVLAVAYPAGMGMGDVKLAGVMGLFLGTAVVPALFLAFLTGTLVGLVVIAPPRRGRPQEGRSVRPLPGVRRPRRTARGQRSDRSLHQHVPLARPLVYPR